MVLQFRPAAGREGSHAKLGRRSRAGGPCAGVSSAQAFDESKYPDWAREWRLGPPTKWDPSKPPGRGQEAPLTPEYQAVFEANLADQAAGGQGTDPTYICIPDGMPRAMNVVFPMEIVKIGRAHV